MTLRDRILKPVVKAVEAAFSTVNVDWYARNGYPKLYRILGSGGPTHTGKPVSEYTALNCSTVWACTRIISETVASLPLHLMKSEKDGSKKSYTDHPLYGVLHDEPNSDMSDMELRETITAHAVTWGNGYAEIVRDSQLRTIGLWPILPDAVTPKKDASGNLVYEVRAKNGKTRTLRGAKTGARELPEVLHVRGLGFDGLTGYSVVSMGRQSIALAQIQEEYSAKYFARGGRRPYILELPTRFKDQQAFDLFRSNWEAAYTGDDAFHKTAILEGGLTYKELGFSQEDAQFLESRQFSISEICRWFRISPHMVGDLSRATFSNIEHLAIEFVQQTLMGWLIRWEKAIKRCCLTPDEKRNVYAKHNVSALLRGDFASRMAGYATLLQNAIASPNEVRDLEDWNAYEGGDDYHLQLNMQTVGGGTPTASQQAQLMKLGTTKKP